MEWGVKTRRQIRLSAARAIGSRDVYRPSLVCECEKTGERLGVGISPLPVSLLRSATLEGTSPCLFFDALCRAC